MPQAKSRLVTRLDVTWTQAPGPDGLQKNDLLLVPEIPDILTIIFQYSIDTGKLPTDWKLANVVPIRYIRAAKKPYQTIIEGCH